MIEQLHNCPNCGAVLDDTGRCNFCGSKVYDLFDIDVSGNHGVKYLRVKTKGGIMIAPLVYSALIILSDTLFAKYRMSILRQCS